MAAILKGESKDIDEDVQLEDYNFHDAVCNVLNNVKVIALLPSFVMQIIVCPKK